MELSAASAANAVHKAANFFADEVLAEPGSVAWLDVPCHWQAPILAIGAWAAGLTVALGPQPPPGAVLALSANPGAAPGVEEACAVSLHPWGLPLGAETPEGWDDLAALVRGQPDSAALRWPPPHQPWLVGPAGSLTGAEALHRAEELALRWGLPPAGRLLSSLSPRTLEGLLAAAVVPAAVEGSVVLTTMTDTTSIARQEGNHATASGV